MQQDLLKYVAMYECQEIHLKFDANIKLQGILAIHNTTLGPALGGCQFLEYTDPPSALYDAVRLAQGMTYKAAIANLPFGGGHLILLTPKEDIEKTLYFKAVGQYIESFGGRYITAADKGVSAADMEIINSETSYVVCQSKSSFSTHDAADLIAEGIIKGIEAAVFEKFSKATFQGLRMSILGLDRVGFSLVRHLQKAGVELYVYDINPATVEKCVKEFGVKSAENLNELLQIECDVFIPCVGSGIINDETLPIIKAKVIVGSANNQLATENHGKKLWDKGILYAPDYVVNVGEIIYIATQYYHLSEPVAKQRLEGIYDKLLEIFYRAKKADLSTNQIADFIVKERLAKK